MKHRKRVTKARADRVILAIVDLIECDNFAEVAASAGYPTAFTDLDRVADIARAMRDIK